MMTDEQSVLMVLEALRRAGWTPPIQGQVNPKEFEESTFHLNWQKADQHPVGVGLIHKPTSIYVEVGCCPTHLQNKSKAWTAMLAVLPEEYLYV